MRTDAAPPRRSVLRRLLAGRSGATATIFAFMVPALVTATAFALDLGTYGIARNQMQTAADAAALAATQNATDTALATATAMNFVGLNIPSSWGAVTTTSDITVGRYSNATGFIPGGGPNANAVQVHVIRSPARGNQFRSVFGFTWNDTIRVSATAAKPTNSFYEPPERTNLDNEAGDFNELYAYCYDYEGTGSPESRRSQMTLISNNMRPGEDIVAISGGVVTASPEEHPTWPDCRGRGKSISFRLRNVRHAKSESYLWGNPQNWPGRPEFNHYTDTSLSGGRESFDGLNTALVETILCDTADKCDNRSGQFIGQRGTNRTPARANEVCQPGKFMYFGWEDRPPGQVGASGSWTDPAWTDTDYDDIAILMKCPREGRLGSAYARLVH